MGTKPRAGHDILEDGQARPETQSLERAGDSHLRQLVGRGAEQRLATVADGARLGANESADRVEEGGLAGAVGTDDAVNLVGIHPKRDVVERQHAAEAHGEVRDVKRRLLQPLPSAP